MIAELLSFTLQISKRLKIKKKNHISLPKEEWTKIQTILITFISSKNCIAASNFPLWTHAKISVLYVSLSGIMPWRKISLSMFMAVCGQPEFM